MLPRLEQFFIALLDGVRLYRPSYDTVKVRYKAQQYLPALHRLALSYIHDVDQPDFVSELQIIQQDRRTESDGISNVELGRAEALLESWQHSVVKAGGRDIAAWRKERKPSAV